jgi:hypothetical protein
VDASKRLGAAEPVPRAPRAATALFRTRTDWDQARTAASLRSSAYDDMRAGELEVSLLAAVWPDAVCPDA